LNQQKEIYKDILNRISSGEYPEGSRLPSVRALLKQYKSSQGTIGQVLTRLRYEGILRVEHGRGCFVNEQSAGEQLIRHVVICERGGGEVLYDKFIASFYNEFASNPDIMVSVEDVCSDKFSAEEFINKIKKMVNQNTLEAIFLDGEQSHAFTFDQLIKLKKLTDNVYCYFNHKQIHRDADITAVYVDWYHIGYIAVTHLLETGCRNLLCLASGDVEEAMFDALNDSAIDAKMKVCKTDEFLKRLNDNCRYDGIFIRNDSNIGKVLPLLYKNGYNPPHDLAIVSLYDTPWASAFDFDLTSINIRPEKMVEILAKIQKGEEEKVSQPVKPRLIRRQSTELFNKK
jgi:hypothetical protein